MVAGIAEALRELSEFSPEFFTNSPQYMNAKIANFDFCGAIRNELDQWNVQPWNIILFIHWHLLSHLLSQCTNKEENCKYVGIKRTWMHSNRMRTVRCSGHLGGGVCPGERIPACNGQTSFPNPRMDKILDTRLWKHYFSATTVADGNDGGGADRLQQI